MRVVATRTVQTPVGAARLTVDAARNERGVLVLGHGAGGGIEARDLGALAAALPGDGITVVRVEQPYRVARKKAAPAPPTLDRAWIAALQAIPRTGPLAVGGRSAGARVACRTASAVGAVAVVALAFPLHPPGRPERSRLDELVGAGVPTLVMQGERDPFGRPEEFPDGRFELIAVPYANHGMAVPVQHDPEAVLAGLVENVQGWLGNAFAVGGR